MKYRVGDRLYYIKPYEFNTWTYGSCHVCEGLGKIRTMDSEIKECPGCNGSGKASSSCDSQRHVHYTVQPLRVDKISISKGEPVYQEWARDFYQKDYAAYEYPESQVFKTPMEAYKSGKPAKWDESKIKAGWAKANEIYPQMRDYLKKVSNWFEKPDSLGTSFYNPETGGSLSTSIHGWSLWLNNESQFIKSIEDLNFHLGKPIDLGPPTEIQIIREAYLKYGYLVVGKRGVAFKNSQGDCYNFTYTCPCHNRKHTTGGGKQGAITWFFQGFPGQQFKSDKCDWADSSIYITEYAYEEYLKYFEVPTKVYLP